LINAASKVGDASHDIMYHVEPDSELDSAYKVKDTLRIIVIIVLSSWQGHCKSSLGSNDECRLSANRPPTLRPSQTTWAVSPPVGCYHLHRLVVIC